MESREKNKAAVEMDGGRRRCRCGVGCGESEDNRIMNTVMLRFRPIAPKPTSIPRGGESFPGGGLDSGEMKPASTTAYRRQKRKYVRVSSKNKQRREVSKTTPSVDNREKKIVTLQLLPDEEEEGKTVNRVGKNKNQLCLDPNDNSANNIGARMGEKDDNSPSPNRNNPLLIRSPRNRTAAMLSQMTIGYIMECWVIAECVMDTCMERVVTSIGCTDEEMIWNLDQDTCPGFVSKGCNTVEWVNWAFKGMMTAGGDLPASELVVWLVVTEKMMPYLQESKTGVFTCRVRLVQNTSGKEKFSTTLPCDTWRMDGGRFAWRLDVKAALSLGQNLKP